jgi:hypothetical protein
VADPTIGDWNMNQLTRFVNQLIAEHDTASNPNRIFDEVEVGRKLRIKDELAFLGSTVTAPGAAGAASALPATPELYVKVLDPTGQVRLIPLYKS